MNALKQTLSRRCVLRGMGAAALAGLLSGCKAESPAGAPAEEPAPTAAVPDAVPAASQYRAMWISYLDWHLVDFSSQSNFEASFDAVLEKCQAMGLNTIIAQVRPFGDALYPSQLFPWSHLCTGTRGKNPGYDPLDCMLRLCHDRGLSLEAWINPYRLRLNQNVPPQMAEGEVSQLHPEWCVEANGGLYLNPAEPAAADYVVQGVTELLEHYAVDGIHFDDYFYPTTEEWIDAAQYAAAGNGMPLADWRRANVTALVQKTRDAVKAHDPELRFGISPQGNPDNNFQQQYSDVSAWITGDQPLVDYICPQVYWGYGYQLKNGSDRFAYENITAEWLAMPRSAQCALYFGLGAFRIGTGDGGADPNSEARWQTGHALADMVRDLTQAGADGYGLFRYEFLAASEYPELAAAETAALTEENHAIDAG